MSDSEWEGNGRIAAIEGMAVFKQFAHSKTEQRERERESMCLFL